MRSINKKAQIEAALAKLRKELKSLEQSESYKNEQSLIRSVEKLLTKFGKTRAELIAFLSNETTKKTAAKKAKSKSPRKL